MTATQAALPMPGDRWVEIKPNSGHRVYETGDRFLVVEEQGERLLCWKDGIRPPGGPRVLGFLVARRFVQEIKGEKQNETNGK